MQNVRTRMVIHGGAGTLSKDGMTPEKEAHYRETLEQALLMGQGILDRGGSSVEAVEAAINVLEDSPYFNAGKGAVFSSEGKNELDASIMSGKTQAAGAVAGVRHIKNPISLARMVMEKSPHVMLAGSGAEVFAQAQGVTLVDEKYFFTEERWKQLQRVQEEEKAKNSGRPATSQSAGASQEPQNKFGTVGAVAMDKNGNLAAGTSTGGMTNKKWGRVGDSPIIGAGTYANNASCAVSATGHGEYFIRVGVARDIAALVEYKEMGIQAAADAVMKKVAGMGGDGGVICVDKNGEIGISFNTEGMYRAYLGPDWKVVVKIYRE